MRRGGSGTFTSTGLVSSSGGRDELTANALWPKAIALLDDRARRIDTHECHLPVEAATFFQSTSWDLPEMAPHRDGLNDAKGLLDDLDNAAWDSYAQLSNYAEFVRRDLRKQFQVELATVAWAKMYEMIVRFDLLPADTAVAPHAAARTPSGNVTQAPAAGTSHTGSSSIGPLPAASPPKAATPRSGTRVVTVHLCEAPGGFVAACNHFLRTQRPDWQWDWLAVSLNPYYGGNDQFAMVDDDALMRATLSHWCFGADDSGDVRRPDNIRAIWAEARRRCAAAGVPGAMLVTADGAIDTSMVPNAQELVNASLHFAEVVAALGLLAVGGSMLWKGFTLFEHTSLCALHLMGCLFEDVTVCKPCTSKACNSEVYVVGRGFRGVSDQVLETLLSKCGEDTFSAGALLPRSALPASFLASAVDAARHFAQCTAGAIRDALDKSGLPSSGPTATAIRRVKERFAAEWFLRMRLLRLERRFFVAPHEAIDGSNNSTSNVLGRRRELHGTLQERQEQYRRRRNDLGLDEGAFLTAAVLQGQLNSSYGSNGHISLGSSPGGVSYSQYGSSPGAVGLGLSGEGGAAGLGLGLGSGAYVPSEPGASSDQRRGGSGGAAGPPMQISGTIAKMMAKMGYREGSGLGRQSQGIVEAVPAVGNAGRAGLGLGRSSQDGGGLGSSWGPLGPGLGSYRTGIAEAVGGAGLGWSSGLPSTTGDSTIRAGAGLGLGMGLGGDVEVDLEEDGGRDDGDPCHGRAAIPSGCWAPAPDTQVLLNDLPLMACEVAAWTREATAAGNTSTCVGSGNSSKAAAGPACSLGCQVPPARLTKSKMIIDDHVLVALRRVRDAYSSAAAPTPAAGTCVSCCGGKGDGGGVDDGTYGACAAGPAAAATADGACAKLCSHLGPLCVAPRCRGPAGGPPRTYWKLASLDASLSVCRLAAAAAAKAGATPHALDLSLHSPGATQYLLQPVTATAPGDGAGSRCSRRGCECSGSAGSGSDSSPAHARADSALLGAGSGSGISSSSSAGGITSDEERPPGVGARIRASAVPAATSGVAAKRDRAAAAWTCTMLATPASEALLRGLQPRGQRTRVRLQPLGPDLDAEALPRTDPFDLFTPESSRALAAAASAEAAEPVATAAWGADPPSAQSRRAGRPTATAASSQGCQGCWLVLGDLSNLRRACCGSPSSSRGPLEGEFDTLYRRRLLWEAATALGALAPGGCAVLRLGDCLTMFTASVLYVLHRSFAQLALVKPFASCACLPERFVVCIGRLEDGGVAVSQLLAGLAAVREVEVSRAPAGSELTPAPAALASSSARGPAAATDAAGEAGEPQDGRLSPGTVSPAACAAAVAAEVQGSGTRVGADAAVAGDTAAAGGEGPEARAPAQAEEAQAPAEAPATAAGVTGAGSAGACVGGAGGCEHGPARSCAFTEPAPAPRCCQPAQPVEQASGPQLTCRKGAAVEVTCAEASCGVPPGETQGPAGARGSSRSDDTAAEASASGAIGDGGGTAVESPADAGERRVGGACSGEPPAAVPTCAAGVQISLKTACAVVPAAQGEKVGMRCWPSPRDPTGAQGGSACDPDQPSNPSADAANVASPDRTPADHLPSLAPAPAAADNGDRCGRDSGTQSLDRAGSGSSGGVTEVMEQSPQGSCRPLAVTGVVPLAVCVGGEFYVYLAARTQELARRQIRACEAALAASAAGARGGGSQRGGLRGREGLGAFSREERDEEREERYADIVRQARLALAEGLRSATSNEGVVEGSLQADGADLRRRYGSMFTRGSQAFAVGSAPVGSGWARAAALQHTAGAPDGVAAAAAVDGWSLAGAAPPGSGLSGKAPGRIAVAAGPPSGNDGPLAWHGTKQGAGGRRSGAGARGSNATGPGGQRFGGGGSGPRGASGSGAAGPWRLPSSYGASPPSATSTPSGANTPYGSNTPYGTSPPNGKGLASHLRSPQMFDGCLGGACSRSPPPHFGSSWHARPSATWESHQSHRHQQQQQPGRLSCSWDRGGADKVLCGGGARGHKTYQIAGGAAGDAANLMAGGEGAGVSAVCGGSSGSGRLLACNWSGSGKGAARQEGPPSATSPSGRQATGYGAGYGVQGRAQVAGNSWRSGKESAKLPAGSGSCVAHSHREVDEDGWERVAGSGRRRVQQDV